MNPTRPEVASVVSAGIARITIDRPAQRNALSWASIRLLREAVAEARRDSAVRVVVLAGAGEEAFCAGADLAEMQVPAGVDPASVHEARGELAQLFLDLWGLGKPTIARVQGFALAGGFGLALACDLVVASEKAIFGAPEINLGLWPHIISVPLLRSMPPKVALELMMTGRQVAALEAERLGFVNRVVAADSLDGAVAELAEGLASKSPTAMRLGRDGFYSTLQMSADEAFKVLHPLLAVSASSADATAAIGDFLNR